MRLTAAALLPVIAAGCLCAADPYGGSPMLGQLGGTYLSPDLRKNLQEDWGFHAGIATLLAEKGVFGMPSADIDARYAPTGDGSLTSIETTYAERSLVGERWWVGAGAGANWMHLIVDDPSLKGGRADERGWSIGGKGMIGMLLTNRTFVEATYHYTPKMLGLNTSSISVGFGYWF